MSAPPAVQVDNVSKAFGSVVAVRHVSFEIAAGHLVTLLGPSGCGKTTTLRLIAGLERTSTGRVWIGGRDVTALPPTERDATMVFQSYALFPHMTVLENAGYGLKVSGRPRAEVRERAEAVLQLVGLAGLGARYPSELSGGQQQRVAVARAVVLEPRVLLFDEPLSNLDARLRRSVRDEIRELQQRLGLAALYVTHDQGEALAISDRVIVMHEAAIAQQGTPHDVYEQPADRFVAQFVGDANVIAVEITAARGPGDHGAVEVLIGSARLTLPGRGVPVGAAWLAIRPDAITIVDHAHAGVLRGTIRRAAYLGAHIEYTVETEAGALFVTDSATARPHAPGTEVGLAVRERGTVLLRA